MLCLPFAYCDDDDSNDLHSESIIITHFMTIIQMVENLSNIIVAASVLTDSSVTGFSQRYLYTMAYKL